ncbi:MAG: sulfur carrier protein ThiS [Spirochaetales bacterium]|jgi:thiazole synthase|nr:sulfur carrier protein ThiS [Spirochaetales bacterium]
MIRVNGVEEEMPGACTLGDFIVARGYSLEQVAVELNMGIIPREAFSVRVLEDGDVLEILQFMGGGCGERGEQGGQNGGAFGKTLDPLMLGGRAFSSRFILGSGKYSLGLITAAVENAGVEMITLALRRANRGGRDNILDYIPKGLTLLANTSGARTAQEAVRIARLARELGCGDFIKIEVIRDSKYLLPDNSATIRATEILAKEGFIVMPYMFPDLNAARDLVNAGAACVMPLAAPIGSNGGLQARAFIKILIDEVDVPVIVDAGIGRPSQACEVMEMGAAAVMANTAIATAGDIPAMAAAFKKAIEAGRAAWLSGLGRVLEGGASASSPLTGFLQQEAG